MPELKFTGRSVHVEHIRTVLFSPARGNRGPPVIRGCANMQATPDRFGHSQSRRSFVTFFTSNHFSHAVGNSGALVVGGFEAFRCGWLR